MAGYCKVCEACGEDGCCSALMCKMDKNGDYCETYLKELQLSYKFERDFFKEIYDKLSEELKNEITIMYDKHLDDLYK
jgi:hypothetical protein